MNTIPLPDPGIPHPVAHAPYMTQLKSVVTRPNIIVGDFTYYSGTDFEAHVTHHYDFLGDRLIIGKFCQIAAGVEFVMNGANHLMDAATTYPFYVMGWDMAPPPLQRLPLKGDTVVGSDVWIGQNATILPGVHIGDGAIIGLNSTVASDIPAYAVAAGGHHRAHPDRPAGAPALVGQAHRGNQRPDPHADRSRPGSSAARNHQAIGELT